MRARSAYITSVGTTTILIAAAVIMLLIVSALVSFRGWPDDADGDAVRSVPYESASRDRFVVSGPPQARAARPSGRLTRVGRAPAGERLTTDGLVKDPTVGQPSTTDLVEGRGPADGAPSPSAPPSAPAPATGSEVASQPGGEGLPLPPSSTDLEAVVGRVVGAVPPLAGDPREHLPRVGVEVRIGDAAIAIDTDGLLTSRAHAR
jgi:hypothetical protein